LRFNVDMGEEIGMDNIAAVPKLVEIGRKAAAQVDWNKELTALDGSKAIGGVTVRKVIPSTGAPKPKKRPVKK
jgi:hypothetical protein